MQPAPLCLASVFSVGAGSITERSSKSRQHHGKVVTKKAGGQYEFMECEVSKGKRFALTGV